MADASALFAGLAKEQFGLILGIGIGSALAAALEPELVAIRQAEWDADPNVVPPAGLLAAGVAQGQVDEATAAAWARRSGFGPEQFAALVNIANTGPALGYAFQAWRRGELSDTQFTTALRRTGLEPQWDAAMRALKTERIDLGAIATAVHRGIMEGQGLIVREPPAGSGRIPRVPPTAIDPVAEAAAHGIDHERLRVLIANTGLPLALGEMLRLLNMGEATEDDVRVAVAESNIRNEYMDAALALRRRLLTPHEYQEGALRGVISRHAADAGSELSGMEAADAQFLYEIMGRPLAVHQIETGIARGGEYGGSYDDIPEPYRDAVRRSNIRPEYAKLAYANRFTIPSYFVLRALVQNGSLSETEGAHYFRELGWPPDLADKAAAAFAGGKSATADKHVTSAETSLFSALHRAYVNEDADDGEAGIVLADAAVPAEAQARILALWRRERELVRKDLTPTQVKKAYAEAKFTRDEAVARLERQGLSAADAAILLDE